MFWFVVSRRLVLPALPLASIFLLYTLSQNSGAPVTKLYKYVRFNSFRLPKSNARRDRLHQNRKRDVSGAMFHKIKPPFPLASNARFIFPSFTIDVWVNIPEEISQLNADGLSNISMRCKGNVVDVDKKFPSVVTVESRPWLKLSSGIEGEFVFEQIYLSGWRQLNSVIGQKFTGLLYPKKVVAPDDWD